MSNDKIFSESGAFQVKQVNGGIYDNVTLDASNGGSIHVLKGLTVNDTLTINATAGATILMPARVTCKNLKLVVSNGSTVNSNDLEVAGPNPSSLNLTSGSTCGLYMVVTSGELEGSVRIDSTLNLFVDFPKGLVSDRITTDHTSFYTRRGWSGPAGASGVSTQLESEQLADMKV